MLLPLCLVASFASSANAAPPTPCPPTRAGAHVAAQPEAWRSAIDGLLASTKSPDKPWGCVGGEVDLVVNGSSATLTVVDARGHTITREVTSPEDIGPLGEALLAKPLLEEPKPAAPSPSPADPASKLPTIRDPRLLASLMVGPRYAGPNHLLFGSMTISANVPFRPWGGGVWLRFDGKSTALKEPVAPTRELVIGAAGYWNVSFGRVEIRPMLRPAIAAVTRQILINQGPGGPGPQPEQTQPQFRSDTQLDFRLGAQGQIAIGLTKRLRAIVGLDVEVSPEQLVERASSQRMNEPPVRLPAYTTGLGLGVEVAVP